MEYKKGDKVTIIQQNRPIKITTIDKVNKTTFNAGGLIFRLSDGRERIANHYNSCRCVPFEPEHRNTIARANRRFWVKNKLQELVSALSKGELSEEVVDKLHNFLEE